MHGIELIVQERCALRFVIPRMAFSPPSGSKLQSTPQSLLFLLDGTGGS
jgi:hypothetical protein